MVKHTKRPLFCTLLFRLRCANVKTKLEPFLSPVFSHSARISRIQDSLHAHIVRSDRAGIDTVVAVVFSHLY